MTDMVCKWEKDEICVNDQCPMCADYCPVPNTPGVCKHEERVEEGYVLSPKGCLLWALKDCNCAISDEALDQVWEKFAELMEQHGYVNNDEENVAHDHNNDKFKVGQKVHIATIEFSDQWQLDGCPNRGKSRYVSNDLSMCVEFVYGSDWGTITPYQ